MHELRVPAEAQLLVVELAGLLGLQNVRQAERVSRAAVLVVAGRGVGRDQPSSVAHETPHGFQLGVGHGGTVGQEENLVVFDACPAPVGDR